MSPTSQTIEIARGAGDWVLERRTEDGREPVLVLCVLIGWIGSYELAHPLSPDEVSQWQSEGPAALSRLAAEINSREIGECRARMLVARQTKR